MENHGKHPLLFLLCAAAVVAKSTQLEPPNRNSYAPSYNPQPHDFPNEQLYHAYVVIQRFKNTISCDPGKITATWIGHDICGEGSYRGFYCTTPSKDGANLTVTTIDFNGFGLCAPKLKGFIDQFPDLAVFQATSNNLSGDIPRLRVNPVVYSLQVKDDFKSSKFDNNIPEKHCIYGRVNFVMGKIFCGTYSPDDVLQKMVEIPGSVVTDAKGLLLSNNKLFGALPADLGFIKWNYLALANNKLTGPIPSSIAHLQDSLFEVLLLNNQLSGCLPHELGMLHKATVIDAGKNQLTGPIPASFSCLASVEQLNLGENRLYGQVPDALCKLATGPAGRLANLTLSGNYFTSVGQACAALIKDGVLDVKNNCIPGLAGQRKPAECAAFQSQPKTCPAPAASAQVACPAAAATGAAALAERKVKEYSSYVTYATLHE
ncbi:unnamed protein product [Urochloa decumbens]|uniref:Uncharacterized protein n=1 Tax=Urochloa decumbens TaxID=240449 RepID=A0ABC9CJL9_9POAL